MSVGCAQLDTRCVDWAWIDTAIGRMQIAATERGVCFLDLPAEDAGASRDSLAAWVARCTPGAELHENRHALSDVADALAAYARGASERFDFELDLRGTAFQRSVWSAERAIPYGETRTYAEVARAIGRPGAVRAVGGATGRNPVPILVPCHRVVASNGLGGFSAGLALKRRLLSIEGARLPA